MNRQQRRALASKSKSTLGRAAGQLESAVGALKGLGDLPGALQGLEGLGELPGQMEEAHRLMIEAHGMTSALVEDYQTMNDELEALKGLVFVLLGPDAEDTFAKKLAEVQAQRSTPGSA